MTKHRLGVCAALALCLAPYVAAAMESDQSLKQLRCINLEVDVEQDPAVQAHTRVTEEALRDKASKALQAALPLLTITPQCGNRFRLLLVLHDLSSGAIQGYSGLLVAGIDRLATVAETGARQEVEVWSGGIQQFRGPVDRATTTAHQALVRSLDHFAEAYHLSGNP